MTTEIEKTFFDTFGIECNISYHQQFNCAQIPRGLEVYKEREKLEKEGVIKIWHRMLTPRPANDCIYWGEYHYPQITDRVLLELICILTRWHLDEREPYEIMSITVEQLKNQILSNSLDIAKYAKAKQQVQAIFEK